MPMQQKIEITPRTIIYTIGIILILWIFIQIRDIIILLFTSFILMSALEPLVRWSEQHKIPRVLAILLIYLIGFTLFGVATSTVIPLLVSQSFHLANQLPMYFSALLSSFHLTNVDLNSLQSQIAPLTQNVFFITLGIFNNIFSTLTILVFAFYFLVERSNLRRYLTILIGDHRGNYALETIEKIEDRLGAWVRGQLLLMSIIAAASYIGLLLLHIEYALPLALVSGILEIVPIIGPIISALPAIVVALATSPTPVLALAVAGLYFIIQQLENNLIVPSVMHRAVGLPPVVTLLALLIGARLGGITGALIAVPAVVTFHIVLLDILPRKT